MAGVTPLPHGVEAIIVADGAVDDCSVLAQASGVRVVEIKGPSGPAAARNAGAKVATGDILVFIDADVVASTDVLGAIKTLFESRPDVSAAFGAYDEQPAEPSLVSQYKNLAHSYVHRTAGPVVQTFWGGFGAIRTAVFRELGGFDERFRRPSVEDIELGYRLTAAGHLVVLDPELSVRHLKRWTFGSLLASNIGDRGIPWTQLILRFGRVHNELNLRHCYRASVILTYAGVGFAAVGITQPVYWWPALLVIAGVFVLNLRFFSYLIRLRGLVFTIRAAPLHILYHLSNGLSFVLGATLYSTQRWLGVRLPGAVPCTATDFLDSRVSVFTRPV